MIDISGVYALEDLASNARINGIKVFMSSASDSIKKTLDKLNFINRQEEY